MFSINLACSMAGRAGVYLLRVASFSHLETVFLHCYLTLKSMVSAICIIFVREHLWFGLQTRLSVPFGHSTASSSWISLSGSSADSFFWGGIPLTESKHSIHLALELPTSWGMPISNCQVRRDCLVSQSALSGHSASSTFKLYI